MPRYRFSWTNLPTRLLRDLSSALDLHGDPAEDLRSWYGARPRVDFVRDAWPTLLESWLARDQNNARRAAQRLRERNVGDTSERNDVDYLSGLRNTSGLRAVIIDLFIEFGEQSSEVREVVRNVSATTTFPPPTATAAPAPAAPADADDEFALDDDELPLPDEDDDDLDADQHDLDDEVTSSPIAPSVAPTTLRGFLHRVLNNMIGGEVFVDHDGDFVFPLGSAVVYVRAMDEPEIVRIFSMLLVEVAPQPKVYELINSINVNLVVGRLVYVNGAIILEHHLLPFGLDPMEIQATVHSLVATADHYDNRIQSELGGETAMPEPAEDEIDV